MNVTAKVVPFSSVVGSNVTLHDESGKVVCQLALLNTGPMSDDRDEWKRRQTEIADEVAKRINAAAALERVQGERDVAIVRAAEQEDRAERAESELAKAEAACEQWSDDYQAQGARLRDEIGIVDRVWKALGITSYYEAGGKEISQIVAAWKARAVAAESALAASREREAALRAALEPFAARYWSHVEEHNTAMSVGGYVPLDADYSIEHRLGDFEAAARALAQSNEARE